jgi:cytochrome c553
MEKEEKFVILVVILLIAYSLFNYLKSTKIASKVENIQVDSQASPKAKNIYDYIVDVINHGSRGHNFKGGEMEGGYISKDDAKIVACYVLELRGEKCPKPYPKDLASGYFSSVCAGCHGNDAKGINGTYPDLTKKDYVGF